MLGHVVEPKAMVSDVHRFDVAASGLATVQSQTYRRVEVAVSESFHTLLWISADSSF